jgi:hypothetical protein
VLCVCTHVRWLQLFGLACNGQGLGKYTELTAGQWRMMVELCMQHAAWAQPNQNQVHPFLVFRFLVVVCA